MNLDLKVISFVTVWGVSKVMDFVCIVFILFDLVVVLLIEQLGNNTSYWSCLIK